MKFEAGIKWRHRHGLPQIPFFSFCQNAHSHYLSLLETLKQLFIFRAQINDKWLKLMNAQYNDYEDSVKKYCLSELGRGWNLFEGIGALVSKNLACVELVDELFDTPMIMVWEKFMPTVEGFRKRHKEHHLPDTVNTCTTD
jgi:hypothetical protein